MLFVITGDGKGKTTSALGMVSRALGQGRRCAVIQFVKTGHERFGEYRTFSDLGVPWSSWGEGFTWNLDDMGRSKELCRQGWDEFKEKASSSEFFMIVLDEFTYVLDMGLLDEEEVLSYLKAHVGSEGFPHVVITGRGASDRLIGLADTVSEISNVKHHYQSGVKAAPGIEF